MHRRVGLAALLSIAMLGAYVHAQFGDKPAALDTVKIKDDLFVIHNDFVPGNTTVLVTNQGVVLVDDKFEIDHENIMAQLKKITRTSTGPVVDRSRMPSCSSSAVKLPAAL